MTGDGRGFASRSIGVLFRSGTSCGLSDAQLLERFIARGGSSEDAFEALVLRHGPMVLDVCRNVLGSSHDAEDAFQATFLILATRADSVRRRSSVASWLHGVALRTAARSKVDAARRRLKEQRASESRGESAEPEGPPRDFGFLHEEVGRLPSKYRDPIVLCYFEGMSQEMAAQQLRCPAGTIGVRLMRAKARLKERLDRRGESIAPAVVFPPISGPLIRSTVRSTIQFTEAGPVSLAVAQLTREVSKAMFMMKLKQVAAGMLIAVTAVSGAGYLTHLAAASAPPKAQSTDEKIANPQPAKPRSDLDELQGTWATKMELNYTRNGEPKSELIAEKWVVSGDTIRTFPRPTEKQTDMLNENTYVIKLDPSKIPKAIDLEMPALGTLSGIYETDGDSLKICWGFRKRPTAFLHDPKNNSTLFTLKRLRRTPEEIAPRYAITPGCFWAVYPSQPGGVVTTRSVTVMSEFETDHLTVHLARPGDQLDDGPYRPVAFDADRKPYYPRPGLKAGVPVKGSDGRAGAVLTKYRLDKNALGGKQITHLGIEFVTPEALERERERGFKPAAENPKP